MEQDHALLCCKDVVDAPFAVINADDYYGPKAFQMLYDYLTTHEDDDLYRYVMIAFHIEKTITENGHVSRGVCQVDKNHYLKEITERTRIEKRGAEAAFTLDDRSNLDTSSRQNTSFHELLGIHTRIFKST